MLHGQYEDDSPEEMVEIAHGYSKDHRPDLKQVMMGLTMSGPANLPVWMEPLNGNSSDKTSFHETISHVRAFQKQLRGCDDFFWIADSALYTPEKLLACPEVCWLSRVPETIKTCSQLTSLSSADVNWQIGENGYKWSEFCSIYGGIKQRWLLIFSQQAYEREKKTLMKRIDKEQIECKKACWHLTNQLFSCQEDACQNAEKLNKKYRFHQINYTIETVEKYEGRGRPNPLSPKILQGYRIICSLQKNELQIATTLNKKGRFVLATNQLNSEKLSNEKNIDPIQRTTSCRRGIPLFKRSLVYGGFFFRENQAENRSAYDGHDLMFVGL